MRDGGSHCWRPVDDEGITGIKENIHRGEHCSALWQVCIIENGNSDDASTASVPIYWLPYLAPSEIGGGGNFKSRMIQIRWQNTRSISCLFNLLWEYRMIATTHWHHHRGTLFWNDRDRGAYHKRGVHRFRRFKSSLSCIVRAGRWAKVSGQ